MNPNDRAELEKINEIVAEKVMEEPIPPPPENLEKAFQKWRAGIDGVEPEKSPKGNWYCSFFQPNAEGYKWKPLDFSTDVHNITLIINQMKKDGFTRLTIEYAKDDEELDKYLWKCAFYKENQQTIEYIINKDLPLAICLAAFKAKEINIKDYKFRILRKKK